LVGPNGAGKSTLLRILATLILPTSGMATVDGHDVAGNPAAVRRRIGAMIGDDRAFFWRLSGYENLIFFASLQGLSESTARSRSRELLDALGLASAAQRRVSGYSSGMRQRLGLARALLHRPPVLLLDEPTANLDLEHRGQAIAVLRSALATGGTSALIASHDAGLAVAVADRVIRLESGRIVTSIETREPTRYRLRIRGLTPGQRSALGVVPESDALDIDDLGDGHALAAAVSSIVSGGGEIVAVESLSSARTLR
jgi:ABC-2 type transport system ATP-binding protein